MAAIARTPFATGAQAIRSLLNDRTIDAVEIPRPPLAEQPFAPFVEALLRAPGFKLDFNGQRPAAALAMVADRILGPGAFAQERARLAEDIAALEDLARGLVDGAPAVVSIRTFFAPGDLVWHLDRVSERSAFRLLWPIGRPAGMSLTSAANINQPVYRAYMRREHPLLCRMDTQVLHTGADVERLWAHRPLQLEAMRSGRFPFLIDPEAVRSVDPNAASIHRVATPAQTGSYHRSSWANRRSPGLQVVITASRS